MDDATIAKQAPTRSSTSRALPPTLGSWGSSAQVSLYLDRCQVDTPSTLVNAAWQQLVARRDPTTLNIVDFGAGDGRFASGGLFREYVGYEVDRSKYRGVQLPANAVIRNNCAFSSQRRDFDACIGNPPYVRNQDLPPGWRQEAARVVEKRTGVAVSGLANAWQYFTLLALSATAEDGICVLVIPYEWVSRPSSEPLRRFIQSQRWGVAVYRLDDAAFDGVQTTSSVTVIDKADTEGSGWRYYHGGATSPILRSTPTESERGVLRYTSSRTRSPHDPYARRGLSPGTQKALVLTEGDRVRNGLRKGSDVVPCVTTLKPVPHGTTALSWAEFERHFVQAGRRCWLPRTDRAPGDRLRAYLNSVPTSMRDTKTCNAREHWWLFEMPPIPKALVASSFKIGNPKCVNNELGARAVGSVCGAYGIDERDLTEFRALLADPSLASRIVAHADGMKKLEVGQMNTLLLEARRLCTDTG